MTDWLGNLAQRLSGNPAVLEALEGVSTQLGQLGQKLDALLASGKQQGEKVDMAMVDLTNITNEVANCKTVEQSAITLMQQLKAQLDALAAQPTVDPAQVQALADALGSSDKSLADAIVANTPAAPAPAPPAPEPTPPPPAPPTA